MTVTNVVRHILVPVDFSKHSKSALLWATQLAGDTKSELTILHVVHDPGDAPGFYAMKTDRDEMPTLEEVAKEMMEDFIENLISKNEGMALSKLKDAQTLLRVGLPVTRILEVAESVEADLIVMGSQGRTGLSHMLLGSKAEQTVRLSKIPVTIVKSQED